MGHHREDQFTGIENGRGRVAQDRHARVFLGFPEGPTSCVPLLLNSLMKRVVVVAGISIAELAIGEKHRCITTKKDRGKASQNQND